MISGGGERVGNEQNISWDGTMIYGSRLEATRGDCILCCQWLREKRQKETWEPTKGVLEVHERGLQTSELAIKETSGEI